MYYTHFTLDEFIMFYKFNVDELNRWIFAEW